MRHRSEWENIDPTHLGKTLNILSRHLLDHLQRSHPQQGSHIKLRGKESSSDQIVISLCVISAVPVPAASSSFEFQRYSLIFRVYSLILGENALARRVPANAGIRHSGGTSSRRSSRTSSCPSRPISWPNSRPTSRAASWPTSWPSSRGSSSRPARPVRGPRVEGRGGRRREVVGHQARRSISSGRRR